MVFTQTVGYSNQKFLVVEPVGQNAEKLCCSDHNINGFLRTRAVHDFIAGTVVVRTNIEE